MRIWCVYQPASDITFSLNKIYCPSNHVTYHTEFIPESKLARSETDLCNISVRVTMPLKFLQNFKK